MKKDNISEKITPAKVKVKQFEDNREDICNTYFGSKKKKKENEKVVCSMCGKELVVSKFWKTDSFSLIGRYDDSHRACCCICKDCAHKLFNYYYETSNKNLEYAIERVCCDLNIFWDPEKLKEAKLVYENNNRSINILSEYMGAIGRTRSALLGKTYWDSPTIKNRNTVIIQDGLDKETSNLIQENTLSESIRDIPLDFTKEDAANKRKILKIFRYDPFQSEKESDKPALYRNLVMMLDEAMEEDFVKLNAALEVVRSFNKIDKYRNMIHDAENLDEPDLAEIKALTALKSQEMKNVTELSKDHGFAGRYALSKAKGAGTLSGIMNQMDEKMYENGILNMYDIETSESINQAAEASMKAIFSQLNIESDSNEQYRIIQNQREDNVKLRKENKELKEKLRILNCKIAKQTLLKEAEEAGLSD